MLLTPEIVEAILDWRQSGTPTLPGLFRPFPAVSGGSKVAT